MTTNIFNYDILLSSYSENNLHFVFYLKFLDKNFPPSCYKIIKQLRNEFYLHVCSFRRSLRCELRKAGFPFANMQCGWLKWVKSSRFNSYSIRKEGNELCCLCDPVQFQDSHLKLSVNGHKVVYLNSIT